MKRLDLYVFFKVFKCSCVLHGTVKFTKKIAWVHNVTVSYWSTDHANVNVSLIVLRYKSIRTSTHLITGESDVGLEWHQWRFCVLPQDSETIALIVRERGARGVWKSNRKQLYIYQEIREGSKVHSWKYKHKLNLDFLTMQAGNRS